MATNMTIPIDINKLDPVATNAIYKDFISGKIINKYELVNNEITLSMKFSELIKHIDIYKKLYDLLGFELISIGHNAYYIARPDRDTLNEIGANIQVILILLCRGLASRGISPEILKDSKGINSQIIQEIGLEADSELILNACSITNSLENAVESIMVNRVLMYKTSSGRYVLSDAGKFIYHLLLETNKYTEPLAPNEHTSLKL
ncbi:condensin complex protein MksE [Ignatzschineria sp. LJL83]